MRKTFLTTTAFATLIISASLAMPAYATNDDDDGGEGDNIEHSYNCNGNGSCAGGDTNNNYDNDTFNNEGGEGGQGGQGGQGGTGYGGNAKAKANASVEDSGNSYNENHNKAYGGDAEAEIENSGNSHNEIDNKNVNKVDVDNKNINKNKNKNTNNNDNSNRNSNKQGQLQGQGQEQDQDQKQGQLQGQLQGQGQGQEVNDSGNSSVNINNPRQPVNTAYAPGLSSGEDTCMGSSSIGAQAVSFGLTLGTTWTDDNCRRLKNSRQLVALGYGRAATALMCVDEDVKNAMDAAGTPCPGAQQKQAAYFAPVQIAEAAPAREYVPMAPIADEKPRKRRVRKALPPK